MNDKCICCEKEIPKGAVRYHGGWDEDGNRRGPVCADCYVHPDAA